MITRLLISMLLILPVLVFSQQKNSRNNEDFDYYIAANKALQAGNTKMAISYSVDGIKKEPANMDLHALLGKAYLLKGDLDNARTELLFVLKVQPRNWDAKRNLISVEYQSGRYSAALANINEFLIHAPYDHEMWIKKISIYEFKGHRHEAERLANRLYAIFPLDSAAKRLHSYYILNKASESVKTGNLSKAKEDLRNALDDDPNNLDANIQYINTLIKNGNKEEALSAIESSIGRFPGNSYFILKKLGILEELKRYPEAIAYAKSLGSGYSSSLSNLKFEAARSAKNLDPYYLYIDILQSNPGNEEAQAYVISTAISRGLYEEADLYIDKALKGKPNNNALLKQKFIVSRALQNNGRAYAVAEKLFLSNPGSSDYQEQYLNLALADAKGLVAGQEWQKAELILKKIIAYKYVQPTANKYLFDAYSGQKKYPEALNTIDNLIRNYPEDESYLLNKIGLLETMGDFAQALATAERLPRNERFKQTSGALSLSLAKKYIDEESYDSALVVIDNTLAIDPKNYQAYNYAMNIFSAMKDYQSGLVYANSALDYFPNDKEVLLKQAGFLQSLKYNAEATDILTYLQKRYPYNDKIRSSLIEIRNIAANRYLVAGQKDSAMYLYKLNYALEPRDTVSTFRIVNLFLDEKNTDSALTYIDRGLFLYPDNYTLLYKKAVYFELMKNFDSAYFYIAKITPKAPSVTLQEYAQYLMSMNLKNQAGFLFLRTFYDSLQSKSSIASFQYTRFYKNNTYTYRLNYAGRNLGTALQHELDLTHIINKKTYLEGNLGISRNIIFPTVKISGSIFRSFRRDYEAELGLKYVKFQDFSTISLIGGLSKTYQEDVWLNARAYILNSTTGNLYFGIRLQSRFYMKNRSEYISAFGGLGTAPDDLSLVFLSNKFLGINNTFVGGGYQKIIKYRTTVGVVGTWTNFRVAETRYLNQYNLFLTVLQKF